MDVKVQVEISAKPEDVFDYIADLSNNPEWQSGVDTTEWTSEPPIAVGSSWQQTLDDGGVVVYVVTTFDPGRSITFKTESGPAVVGTITRTVQKLDIERCRVRMELTGKAKGWRVVLTPLLRRAIRSSIGSDYRRLKKRLEG
ncbi:MAG: hypothetical protein GY722_16440 [bacterium]|nr:hypothetical protein [bacterium]